MNELKKAKATNEKAFTKEQQAELDELVLKVVDLEDEIEKAPEAAKQSKYEVPKGTEKMVHVKLVHGNRYDPRTGKETATPAFQIFNYGEWQLFKASMKRLGYTITEVLHDPYGEATELLNK